MASADPRAAGVRRSERRGGHTQDLTAQAALSRSNALPPPDRRAPCPAPAGADAGRPARPPECPAQGPHQAARKCADEPGRKARAKGRQYRRPTGESATETWAETRDRGPRRFKHRGVNPGVKRDRWCHLRWQEGGSWPPIMRGGHSSTLLSQAGSVHRHGYAGRQPAYMQGLHHQVQPSRAAHSQEPHPGWPLTGPQLCVRRTYAPMPCSLRSPPTAVCLRPCPCVPPASRSGPEAQLCAHAHTREERSSPLCRLDAGNGMIVFRLQPSSLHSNTFLRAVRAIDH